MRFRCEFCSFNFVTSLRRRKIVEIVAGGAAAGDVYIGISGIIGTTFDDTFIDGAGANHYEGGGGQDTVSYIDSTAGVTVDFSNNSGSLG